MCFPIFHLLGGADEMRTVYYLISIILICCFISACNPDANPLKKGPDPNVSTKVKPSRSLSFNIPKNEKTGAYEVCLREEDVKQWERRLRGERIDDPLGLKKMADDLTSPLTSMVGMVLAPTHLFNLTGPIAAKAQGNPDGAMPICGNWCGSGYPSANTNPKPVDALDAACMAHDLCYRQYGLYSCQCDQLFVDMLTQGRSILDMNQLELKMVALFRGSPCFGGCKKFAGHQICGGRGGFGINQP